MAVKFSYKRVYYTISFLVAFSAILRFNNVFFFSTANLPKVDLDEWWGPEELKGFNNTSVREFQVRFHDEMILDLKYRIRNYKSFPSLKNSAFTYGFNSDVLEEWLSYWVDKYPFKEREDLLNKYPQFKTNIQGLDIHFIWVKPEVPQNTTLLPLILFHGWPSSVREFYESIPFLTVNTDEDFALEVVVPSLPGYGFSDATNRPGLGADKMAVIFRNLMHRLGHTKYFVQGGDFGTLIARHMATFFPEEVQGFHCNFPIFFTPLALLSEGLGSMFPSLLVDQNVVDRIYPLSRSFYWMFLELGYVQVFANKPDTFGIAMSDSPAGLLATILHKFSMASNKSYTETADGGLSIYSKDQMLDNIMIYWSTHSITSSLRMYAESLGSRLFKLGLDRIPSRVPTWVIATKNDVAYQPPFIIKLKHVNLLHETVLQEGGHFIALELPKIFAEDVLEAVREFRRWHFRNGNKNEQ